ncbi:MAG: hypothetical protein ACFCVK_10040 [Acidimicrobiales bacterium]
MSLPAALIAVTARTLASGGPWTMVAAVVLWLGERGGMLQLGTPSWPLPLVFLALGVAHEHGHVIAIVLLGGRVTEVAGSLGTGNVRIVYDAVSRRRSAASVVAGPGAALATGTLFWLGRGPTLPAVFALLCGVGHALTLLAPVGDGLQLRRLRAPIPPPPLVSAAD